MTDLNDKYIPQIPQIFKNEKYQIITLYISNKEELEKRVLEATRSSRYKNVNEAIQINEIF